ncbi:DUF58 domain-containing protein [Falsihalocynthiibacter arcticus]|uniref:MoxR protein n=1 Tax=Falsihalocynthiibacter arcticus TaxID=1579316 RepID=A0A126UZI8_9RHOB|nr:DUF58 domain-containing protein [Falsihalocynthiibacter arcticus]AML51125.1 MoxR protein [Falsihalocynthiibacter arcticus]
MTKQLDPRIHVDAAHLRALATRARGISFLPAQPSKSILNGQHASKLKGRGLNFEELRHYSVGDDVRTIDWKVTARTGEPYVRVYTEERDHSVLLIVDQRMSMFFGSKHNMKSVTAAEAAALAAQAIHAKADRVGGIVFNDTEMTELRPKANAKALSQFIATLAKANCALHAKGPSIDTMSLNEPLKAACRLAKTNGQVLIFSDFDGMNEQTFKLLRTLSQKNDVILFSISDPFSNALPEGIEIVVSDGEIQGLLKTNEAQTRMKLLEFTTGRLAELMTFAHKFGLPVLPLTCSQDTLPQLLKLLGKRQGPK